MSTPPNDHSKPPGRHQVQWGRAPQTVFRAGPLPGQVPAEREPARPVAPRPATSILSGSMIPRRRPVVAPDLPVPEVQPDGQSPVLETADAPVRPNTVTSAATPEVGAAVVRPSSGRGRGYLALAAVAAAAVTVAGAAWLFKQGGTTSAPAVAEVVTPTTPPPAVPSLPVAPSGRAEEIPAATPPESVPTAAPSAPVAPVQRSAEVAVVRPPVVAVEPLSPPIVVANDPVVSVPEPVGPAPTVALPPPSDPNAPIVTRPQPLDQGPGGD
ncbi:hypothetical protein [uncultured Brevundimonas sp.]|uniref:hypothetical protein n=1 Tax=uncultured Brevundimonas sp. TaxID=213418 RepID=UPI0030EBB881